MHSWCTCMKEADKVAGMLGTITSGSLPSSYVRKWETGEKYVSPSEMARVCRDHRSQVLCPQTEDYFPYHSLALQPFQRMFKVKGLSISQGIQEGPCHPAMFLSFFIIAFLFFFFLFFSFPVVGRVKDTFKINTRETKAGELAGLNDV